ncbi:MAG: YbaB/EbfC family nucleoid-associated protein, partial [Candidatus Binatia bacterium]
SVQGSAGGGMVQVTVNGQFHLTAVKIEAAAVNADEKDLLEDLILAAVNDGMRKAREMASAEMAKLTGGLKIPGLMP